jgi:hypothetical protein
MRLRDYNIIALGYPRDNAVLRQYQRTTGLTFQVLPDWDYSKDSDARPRVQEVLTGTPIPDNLAGDPQLKRCVLTRRLHSDGRNVVTMIAGNSGRAMAEVVDRLCKGLAASKLFQQMRDLLKMSAEPNLPEEFQCVFVVEFSAQGQEVQDVRAEYCARVPSPKSVVKDSSLPAPKSRLG